MENRPTTVDVAWNAAGSRLRITSDQPIEISDDVARLGGEVQTPGYLNLQTGEARGATVLIPLPLTDPPAPTDN